MDKRYKKIQKRNKMSFAKTVHDINILKKIPRDGILFKL